MNNFIFILLVLLLVLLAVSLSTLLFLGIGYTLSIIVPLSLFENAVLAIGSTFVLAFSIAAITIAVQISRHGLFLPGKHLNDEFDEDEDENVLNLWALRNAAKIGRNALCPCGSGLKYKRCCGK